MLFIKGKAIYESQGYYVGCLNGLVVGKDLGPIESIEPAAQGK